MSISCSICLHNYAHPFGISFVDNVCSGCYTHQEKDSLNWHSRLEALRCISESAKKLRSKRSTYDCVVPVRGVAEDYFVVEQVLSLGLNPLLVATNDYFFNDLGWYNLHNLITVFDLDSHVFTPNSHEYRELVTTSLRKHLHILYPSLSLNSAYPVHVAIEREIPFIIWGQLQPLEQVGKFSHLDSVEMTKWSQIEHDRLGYDIAQVIGNGAQLNPQNLTYYDYPEKTVRLGSRAPTGVYLSNYIRWDPLKQNHSILKYGFKPQYETATFDPYERAGSSVYYTAHEISRLLRHGYRKARDHINREIRHGRIDKETGIRLYQHYYSTKINLAPFFDWLRVSESGKQWILQHLFSPYSDLIADSSESTNIRQPEFLPPSVKNMVGISYSQHSEFVAFGKGV
jgi:hypothetical protein